MTLRSPPPRPVGWPLLPVPDEDGRLAFAPLEDAVRDLVRVILLTRPGEQLMRPDFGAGVQRFLEQPNTVEVRRRLRDTVSAGLARWEPRIGVDEVDVAEVPDRPTVVRVRITYRIRRTGAARALALTVPLRG